MPLGRLLYGLLSGFLPLLIHAQSGSPFYTHFEHPEFTGRPVQAIVSDEWNDMLLMNQNGIMHFNSEEWQRISIRQHPTTIAIDPFTFLGYAGFRNDHGYLEKKLDGQYHFTSLSGNQHRKSPIKQILIAENEVIFRSERSIYSYDRFKLELDQEYQTDSIYPEGFFLHNDILHAIVPGSGFIRFISGKKEQMKSDLVPDAAFAGQCDLGSGLSLLCFSNGALFTFNGSELEEYRVKDHEYLVNSITTGLLDVSSDWFACSTILGGCIIIDKNTGETRYTISYQNGLPDDEIYAMGLDQNGGLWLSHEYGLTRVDFSFPATRFDTYEGLEGNLFSVNNHPGKLFVGTSEGIYELTEKRSYEEKEVVVPLVNKAPPSSPVPEITQEQPVSKLDSVDQDTLGWWERRKLRRAQRQQEKDDTEVRDTSSERSGIARFFSRMADNIQSTFTREEEQIEEQPTPPQREKTSYIRKKIQNLLSVNYEFRKVEGLNKKCRILVRIGDHLLAGTNSGLYEVIDGEAMLIYPDLYVGFLVPSVTPGQFFAGSYQGLFLMQFKEDQWEVIQRFPSPVTPIISVTEADSGDIWAGSENYVYHFTREKDSLITQSYRFNNTGYNMIRVKKLGNSIFLLTNEGVFTVTEKEITPYSLQDSIQSSTPRYLLSQREVVWISDGNRWISISGEEKYNIGLTRYLDLFTQVREIHLDAPGNLWIVQGRDELYRIESGSYEPDFSLNISQVRGRHRSFDPYEVLNLNHNERSLRIYVSAPFYLRPESTQFQYYLEEIMDGWSGWTRSNEIDLPVLPTGKYVLNIRARNVLGELTESRSITFSIRPPFWQSWWFIGLCALFLILILILIIRLRLRKLRHDKMILEERVRERTMEIERQKNEIENQQKEITDSILYAQMIQRAVMPSLEEFSQLLPELFILFLPRDIVSGDFYYLNRKDGQIIIAAADCTGHGVPGAFMSMLGISQLNEIISNTKKVRANTVLNQLRESIKQTLATSGDSHEPKDGLDITLCVLDEKLDRLEFSGAFNPLYQIRDGELIQHKADRMPIGYYYGQPESFRGHKVNIQEGDIFYMFSDGYADQLGGPKTKKFTSKRFRELLLRIHDKPLLEQKEILHKSLMEWKGNTSQLDDILIIGLRI